MSLLIKQVLNKSYSSNIIINQNIIQQKITEMDDVFLFQTIEYRNGLYEGLTKQSKPQGIGLFFDDDSALYCSIWKSGTLNSRTAVFISQGKYFYGQWLSNKPHGFNVFRSGDIILLGNYINGKLSGRFVIIFEKQSFIIIVNNQNEIKENIEKKYYRNEDELKEITNKCFEAVVRVDDYFEFVFFLKNSFCLDNRILKLEFSEGDLKFGYDRGLGIVFDDNNFIRKQGYLDQNNRICGLGSSFGIVHEEGNFETENIIKYNTGNKPVEKVRNLFKRQHIKSIFYRNDFLALKTQSLISLLDETLKSLINKIVQLPNSKILSSEKSSQKHTQTLEQLNDSLQYHPKKRIIDNSDKIKRMRLELDLSAGKVGSEISSPFIKYENNFKNEFKQLYITPLVTSQYLEPEGIRFNKPQNNLPYVTNRQMFLEENKFMDYRKRYDHLLYSPNSSRYEEEKEKERQQNKDKDRSKEVYLDRYAIIKRQQKQRQKVQPSYVKKNREKDRLLDQQNQFLSKQQREFKLQQQIQLKQQQDLLRQKAKQKQLYQQITKQIQKQKQKQSQLNRERQITFAIQKQVEELPKFIKKLSMQEIKHKSSQVTPKAPLVKVDAPAQTSFSYQQSSVAEKSSEEIVVDNKFSEQKSTAIKPHINYEHEIHYNPFLRTFVSSKYPPLVDGSQPFKKVQIVPNLKELNLRPTITSQEMEDDSLQKNKDFKLTEYKPPRYLIQGKTSPNQTDSDRYAPANIPTPKKKSSYTPISASPENKLKQALQDSITRDKSKSYLQIHKTSVTNVEKEAPRNSSKSPLNRNPSYNKLKRPQSPYTPVKNRHKDHVNQKIIEIEHQRTSPQGKKTTSFERIIKKYHHVSEKA